ncbi:hypothetical protein [Flavobacterium urocaniciphilum]|uniref:Uncharacterized protein n=1 Tax=Flavobacterium urocaniciphilum TaxID=1299341 RepID=A0A1H9DSF2_9FLAO|nr:hypothetical protein [Flavobacterium urocaniciphilum]SEQ16434.1 hypothetical protein SAMN05444005_10846 [Flavobacterium urocaniciphilum]
MKNFLVLSSIIVLFYNCKTLNKPQYTKETIEPSDTYTITKIDSLNAFYFVYCTKNKLTYKIISKKEPNKYNSKVEINKSYHFTLINFPDFSKNENPLTGFNPLVNCFMLDKNTEVCKEKNIVGLYTTKNLKGLSYLEGKEKQ